MLSAKTKNLCRGTAWNPNPGDTAMPHLCRSLHLRAPHSFRTRAQPTAVPHGLGMSGGGGSFRSDGGRVNLSLTVSAVGLLVRLLDINAALEVGAVFDADALGNHITDEGAFIADIHAVAGGEVALHLADHHDLAGGDVGRDHAVAAHGNPVAGKIDGAFDPAINI